MKDAEEEDCYDETALLQEYPESTDLSIEYEEHLKPVPTVNDFRDSLLETLNSEEVLDLSNDRYSLTKPPLKRNQYYFNATQHSTKTEGSVEISKSVSSRTKISPGRSQNFVSKFDAQIVPLCMEMVSIDLENLPAQDLSAFQNTNSISDLVSSNNALSHYVSNNTTKEQINELETAKRKGYQELTEKLQQQDCSSLNHDFQFDSSAEMFTEISSFHLEMVSKSWKHLNDCSYCKKTLLPQIELERCVFFESDQRSGTIFSSVCMFNQEHLDSLRPQHKDDFLLTHNSDVSQLNDIFTPRLEKECQNCKRYHCTSCSKTFLSKDYLQVHFRTHSGYKPFVCHVCSRSFHRSSLLFSHLKIHSITEAFPCPKCEKQSKTKRILENHLRNIHKDVEKVQCNDCDRIFFSKKALEVHLEVPEMINSLVTSVMPLSGNIGSENTDSEKERNVVWPYICDSCSKTFSNCCTYRNHLKVHTRHKTHECIICKKLFVTLAELQSHMLFHTKEPLYECAHCQKSFSHKYTLTLHIRTHTREKPFACKFCLRAFAQHSDLRKHVRIHTGIKPFYCSECGVAFPRKHHLLRHLLIHDSQPTHLCDYCCKIFKCAPDLKSHLRKVHLPKKREYKCSDNNSQFIRKTTLAAQMTERREKRKYICKDCGRSFKSSTGFEYHVTSHTGDKSFCCDICGSKFSRKFILKQHMLTHSQEKAHGCYICHQMFCTKSAVSNHMVTHSTARPYTCNQCDKSFRSKAILRSHLVTHMMIKPFVCEYCDRSFSRRNILTNHHKMLHTSMAMNRESPVIDIDLQSIN